MFLNLVLFNINILYICNIYISTLHTYILGGSGISIPMARPYSKLKQDMIENVKNGKYHLGELIEPKEFKKYVIDSNSKISESTYMVSGRKIPLHIIRKNIYEEHSKLGILRSAPTINRFLILWADHAEVLGSGTLLLTVKVIYSKDIFYTDEEIEEATGKILDVQQVVERPSIYILGHTQDSIAEKLTYVNTRLDDINTLTMPMEVDGKVVQDTMRFFQGKVILTL